MQLCHTIEQAKLKQELLDRSVILIVDDMEFNLMILEEILSGYGFKHIHKAATGQEALEQTKKHRPDLVILDLMLPDITGFEYCNIVKADMDFKDIPILVQTGLENAEGKNDDYRKKAFAVGASDFVSKPIEPDEIIARSLVHLEKQLFLKDLLTSRQCIQNELDSARRMQKMLMPNREQIHTIEKNFGINIESHFEPSSDLGGDFWGVHQISDNKVGLYIVDFSGHGVTAALNTFRLHTLMQEYESHMEDPGTYMATLNEGLTKLLNPEQFATMFYGVFDKENNILSYATAATPSPVLITKGKNPTLMNGEGLPVGITKTATYKTQTIPLEPGSSLLLYSDALIETEDAYGKILDEETLLQLVQYPSDGIFDSVLNTFNSSYRGPNLTDDLTINLYTIN